MAAASECEEVGKSSELKFVEAWKAPNKVISHFLASPWSLCGVKNDLFTERGRGSGETVVLRDQRKAFRDLNITPHFRVHSNVAAWMRWAASIVSKKRKGAFCARLVDSCELGKSH